ncbi:MAG: 2-hydroxyacyl-CoA dehydratase subunit D [Dehalococcoidia bacterium]
MAKGLDWAKRLYENRSQRAKELREEGKKVIGYICAFPPRELITAAGLVPYRITGTLQPITEADAYLETLMCPYVRSCLDLGVKRQYDFLDGMIWPHTCDNIQKTFDIWKHYVPYSYLHYLDVPHMPDPSSFEFFTEELDVLKGSLEEFGGVKITEERLKEAIGVHNENRALLRQLTGLRKQAPPLISATEMTQVMMAAMSVPVYESNEMLKNIIEEVSTRKDGPQEKATRLLVYGCEIDDIAFINLVEECGANVVIDDLCMGTRDYWKDVATEGDPLQNLADRILGEIMCPRTFRRSRGTRQQDLDNRFSYIRDFAKEFNVNGAILYIIRYCDTFEFDAPEVRDYLEEAGIPVLYLEDDYSLTSIQGFKTRIQAFLEMIE